MPAGQRDRNKYGASHIKLSLAASKLTTSEKSAFFLEEMSIDRLHWNLSVLSVISWSQL